MTKRKVILARHGQTELNRVGIIQGSGVDPSLNDEGREQAKALFGALSGKVDLIGSSGMQRAKETAEPFIISGLPYYEDKDFREICWGEYEGKVAKSSMRIKYKELLENWENGNLDARIPGGESAAELADRLQKAWRALLNQDFECALVVLHGRALRCITCWLNGESVSQMNHYAHSNCGYYVIEVAGDNSWVVAKQNVTTHLSSTESVH